VLGHGGLTDRHAIAQSAGIHASGRQLLKDRATGGISQSLEDVVLYHANT
jgi:hypothetical protein